MAGRANLVKLGSSVKQFGTHCCRTHLRTGHLTAKAQLCPELTVRVQKARLGSHNRTAVIQNKMFGCASNEPQAAFETLYIFKNIS